MILSDVGFIAADTTRTRVYLRALVKNHIIPSSALIIKSPDQRLLPGEAGFRGDSVAHERTGERAAQEDTVPFFNDLENVFEEQGIEYQVLPSSDINSSENISVLKGCFESVFIYSGFGGVILRNQILDSGKKFLHIHGGYLPDFKGSTTNYFSLLSERRVGASAIFLTKEIDGGPILLRRWFEPPDELRLMDHHHDSKIRAKVLVETLSNYLLNGKWPLVDPSSEKGQTYFVIHPVLKHAAILG